MRSPGSAFDLRAALSEEVRKAIEEFDKSDAGPKAVHACRVHLKRARALARVGYVFAPGLSAVFNDSARTIMRSLSTARDLTALAQAAHGLAKRSKKRAAAALEAARDALRAEGEGADVIDREAVLASLRDLLALAQVWPEASARQIARGARRVARRARKTYRKGAAVDAAADKRHQWRQREKDRLYAETLLEDAWPRRRPHRHSRGKRLVDLLGRERDVVLLVQRLEASPAIAGEEAATAAALKALRQRREQLARRARRVAAKLHKGRA